LDSDPTTNNNISLAVVTTHHQQLDLLCTQQRYKRQPMSNTCIRPDLHVDHIKTTHHMFMKINWFLSYIWAVGTLTPWLCIEASHFISESYEFYDAMFAVTAWAIQCRIL
jgi:hypothetical protein